MEDPNLHYEHNTRIHSRSAPPLAAELIGCARHDTAVLQPSAPSIRRYEVPLPTKRTPPFLHPSVAVRGSGRDLVPAAHKAHSKGSKSLMGIFPDISNGLPPGQLTRLNIRFYLEAEQDSTIMDAGEGHAKINGCWWPNGLL